MMNKQVLWAIHTRFDEIEKRLDELEDGKGKLKKEKPKEVEEVEEIEEVEEPEEI